MIEIKFNQNKKQSIAYDDNKPIGECDYIELDGTWNIIHTEVSDLYQGQGIAKKLVKCIIENAEKYNKNLIAECSYRCWSESSQEYAAALSTGTWANGIWFLPLPHRSSYVMPVRPVWRRARLVRLCGRCTSST